jgi:hypothetical protein
VAWGQLAIAAATTVVLAVLSIWYVVRMLARFRRRGYITRYT